MAILDNEHNGSLTNLYLTYIHILTFSIKPSQVFFMSERIHTPLRAYRELYYFVVQSTTSISVQGRRKDWNAGEVAIPEFHCPRCRDHWYGLTQYPCDEELARLIREGLWYTGKEDKGKARDGKRHSARNRSINSAKREFGSLSSESLTGTSKRRGRKGEQDQSSRDPFSIGEDAIDEAQGKRKRRITFKLDDESIQGGGKGRGEEERVRLSSRDQTDGSLAEGTLLRDRGKHSNGSGTRGNEQSGDESGSLTDVGKSRRGRSRHSGGEGQDSSDGSSVWDTTASRQRTNRRRSRGKEEKGLSSAEDGSGGEGASGRGRNRLGKGQSLRDGGHQGEELGSESSRTGLGGGREDGHVGAGQSGLGAGLEQTNSQSGILAGHTGYVSSTGTGKGLGTSGTGIDSSNTAALSSHSRRGSLQSSSQVSKSGDRDDGGKRSQLGQADHGKKVRKAVGYMRAVSPSESEWGDPTHGRLYISSTATSSRAGSTSNLHRDQEDDNKPGLTLPPLIPPITNRKPLFAPMLDGFEFTRAWTFSYHNAGPLTAKLRSH